MTGSNINVLPEDIVLKGDLYLFDRYIMLPVLNIGGRLFLKDSHTVIVDCTYIDCYIRTAGSKILSFRFNENEWIFFSTGVIS